MLVSRTAVLPGRAGTRADLVRCATGVGMGSSVGVGNFIALGRARAILVDLEGIDAPVGALEGRRVVLDVRVAGASVGRARAAGPDGAVAGPVAAEGDVEDLNDAMLVLLRGIIFLETTYDLEVLEVRADVAVSRETSGGGTPARRIGATAANVRGDACIGEIPDANSIAGPLSRIDTATSIVETVAVGRIVLIDNSTAGVGGLVRSLNIAVVSVEVTGEARVGD